eukprot:CAMPEP_0185036978 /NCGR_PEP_ID=MMETSP1103-20130426/30777_1 /TAXON_ID=36769 /ORGANISM="Paraphysomonas bandaiensis, Strain Caron Lab Isolate" /LENGTH=831 /DNA_ID=CAMNT_0027574759 /DNA_START=395 /DNA_END=2893 /DNA_ORIENTATION=-
MAVSMMTSNTYSRLHSMSLADTLEICGRAQETWIGWYLFTLRYLPLSPKRHIVEFKIIYALFRNTYWLPGDFDYGAYLSGCLARYSLKLINVENSSWVVMIILCGVNYIRMNFLGNEFGNCEGFKYVDEKEQDSEISSSYQFNGDSPWTNDYSYTGRQLREVSDKCTRQHLNLFFASGIFICAYVLTLYFMGKFYEEQLMARAGVVCTDDYEDFLSFVEANHLKADEERLVEVKMPNRQKEKRKNIIKHFGTSKPKKNLSVKGGGFSQSFRGLQQGMKKVKLKIWIGGSKQKPKVSPVPAVAVQSPSVTSRRNHRQLILRPSFDSNEYPREDNSESQSRSFFPSSEDQALTDTPSGSVKPAGRGRRSSLSAAIGSMVKKVRKSTLKSNESAMIGGAGRLDNTPKTNFGMSFFKRVQNNEVSTEDADVKLSEDFSSIFLFDSPELFFRTVEIAIMLNSLYLSLWVSNFATAVERALAHSWVWQILMLVPLVLVIPLIGEIVKIASLISAIAELDVDVIGTIVEDEEEKENLCKELREKVLRRIRGAVGDQKQVLRCLFNEIDTDLSGSISKAEFRDMLRALQLHYSDEKYRKLFHQVDVDKSGVLSIRDLNRIIFPDDAVTEDLQRRRDILASYNENRSFKQSRPRMGIAASMRHLLQSPLKSAGSKKLSVYNGPASPTNGQTDDRRARRSSTDSGSSSRRASMRRGSRRNSCVTKLGASFIQHMHKSSSDLSLESTGEEKHGLESFGSCNSPTSWMDTGKGNMGTSPGKSEDPNDGTRKFSAATPFAIDEEISDDNSSSSEKSSRIADVLSIVSSPCVTDDNLGAHVVEDE